MMSEHEHKQAHPEWWVAIYSDDEVSCWTELFADYEEAELHVRKICEKLWDLADGVLDPDDVWEAVAQVQEVNGNLQIYVEPVKLRQTVADVPAGSYDL
jgi:hypothetical protein